jgi:hypothetical protein
MATDAARHSVACSLFRCKPKDFFCKRNFVPVWSFVFMKVILPIRIISQETLQDFLYLGQLLIKNFKSKVSKTRPCFRFDTLLVF